MSTNKPSNIIGNDLLDRCKRINALSEIGLTYADDSYDVERYEELRSISREMMAMLGHYAAEDIEALFLNEREYKTPQVDVRTVVFDNEDRLLLVQERSDGKWSLPGGWADVGFSASEVAVKEVQEETGLDVKADRLIAVFDKKCHPHPPHLHYVYKMFIECRLVGGVLQKAFDILDLGFFDENHIPSDISEERVTPGQIKLMFEYHRNPDKKTMFD